MSITAVIYKSKYGTTEKYAKWIAQELDAVLLEASNVKPSQLAEYDVVIYGGWIMAGKISGVKLVKENKCKALVVFSVGIADPISKGYYRGVLEGNFTQEQLYKTKVFNFRGGIDYEKLSVVHKGMLSMVKKHAEKKAPEQRTDEEKAILEALSGNSDFTDKAAIAPLVEYVRAL